jgi:C-terminal processing protease CtpA/Prc
MKRTFLLIGLAVLLAAAPAICGEHKKCTASAQDCLDHMVAKLTQRGLIGVDGDWDDEAKGYVIEEFMEESNAPAAGIEAGDMLVAINGIPLSDKDATEADVPNRKPGDEVAITILREGVKHEMKLVMIAMTEEVIAEKVGHHMLAHANLEPAKGEEEKDAE